MTSCTCQGPYPKTYLSDVIDAVHLNSQLPQLQLITPHTHYGKLVLKSRRRRRCCSSQVSYSRTSQQCYSSSSCASRTAAGTTCSGTYRETATAVQRDKASRWASILVGLQLTH